VWLYFDITISFTWSHPILSYALQGLVNIHDYHHCFHKTFEPGQVKPLPANFYNLSDCISVCPKESDWSSSKQMSKSDWSILKPSTIKRTSLPPVVSVRVWNWPNPDQKSLAQTHHYRDFENRTRLIQKHFWMSKGQFLKC